VRSARTPFPNSTAAERNENILSELRGRVGAERRARYVSACALLVPGFDPIVARGECEGLIADEPQGSAGFGYDPIFVYPPFEMTFAQAGQEKKNAVSHRSKAIRALREKLRSVVR
jgi:XTP/dITP diphosphohydrolase